MPRVRVRRLPGVSEVFSVWPKKESLLKRQQNKNIIPVEVSDLVLNLDSENSPYVRPFDPDIDGKPVSPTHQRWNELRSVRELVARQDALTKKYRNQATNTASRKFNIWRITNYDILFVALRGPLTKKQSHYEKYVMNKTNILFDENGIPYNVLNSTSKTIAYMLHRQKVSDRQEPTRNDLDRFQRAVKARDSLFAIDRLITGVIGTPTGRWLVANSADVIGRACGSILWKVSPQEMLSFLNNLIILLQQEKADIPPVLLQCAISTSIQSGVLETAQKYIGMTRNKRVTPNGTQVNFILGSLEKLITSYAADINPHTRGDPTYPLLAIYSFLTGRVMGEKEWQPSLWDFISDRAMWKACHERYLSCLARLGAFRAMWHVWRMHPRRPMEDVPKAEAFARAINGAMSVNPHLTKLSLAPSFTRVGQTYTDHFQSEIIAIIESTKVILTPQPESPDVQEEERERVFPIGSKDIEACFENGEVGASMVFLQSLLSSRIPANVNEADNEEDNDADSKPS
ncbi:hypothetical protein Daesc_008429 [Daldinia eschscholtzii]|uniref:Uncharacterized protein n=1 Tax=Daldinia eschscholtzii TaxID=292717 RepID=A0AAX6MCA8_9PEZI